MMIAFYLFGRPIYWYGIGYAVTFIVGYRWLGYVTHMSMLENYSGLKRFLQQHRDDLFLAIVLGVIGGGRLGEILLYSPGYYRGHPEKLLAVRQGGMSFVGGICGVIIALMVIKRFYKLSRSDMRILGDIVVCIVPLGSLLGRIANMLNQELYGLPIDRIPEWMRDLLERLHLTYIYTHVDTQLRVNVNIIQSLLEGALIRGIVTILFHTYRKKGRRSAGKLGAIFLCLYGSIRFVVEYLKDLPVSEQRGVMSISQAMSLLLVAIGGYLFWTFGKAQKHHTSTLRK